MGHAIRERILVVEDDAAARVGLEQLIRGWGFDVEAAADGQQALERIAAFHPGIVLTDLVVPKGTEIRVRVGDRVRGGETIMGVLQWGVLK